MSNQSTECTHADIACDITVHQGGGSPIGAIAEAQAKCRGCGVQFHTGEQARSAGVIDRVEAARREVRAEVLERYTLVRTRLLGVPSRVAQRLPHLAGEVVPILDELLREALEEQAVDEVDGR